MCNSQSCITKIQNLFWKNKFFKICNESCSVLLNLVDFCKFCIKFCNFSISCLFLCSNLRCKWLCFYKCSSEYWLNAWKFFSKSLFLYSWSTVVFLKSDMVFYLKCNPICLFVFIVNCPSATSMIIVPTITITSHIKIYSMFAMFW